MFQHDGTDVLGSREALISEGITTSTTLRDEV